MSLTLPAPLTLSLAAVALVTVASVSGATGVPRAEYRTEPSADCIGRAGRAPPAGGRSRDIASRGGLPVSVLRILGT